ncbi:polyprotein, partial [Operophtera brumata]
RNNHNITERDLQCGDTILIVDPTLPRNTWPRGIVVRTYPGPDGRTRNIEARTSHGTFKRPCSKAILLVPGDNPHVSQGASETADTGHHVLRARTSLHSGGLSNGLPTTTTPLHIESQSDDETIDDAIEGFDGNLDFDPERVKEE